MRGLSRASWFALGLAVLHLGLAWMMRTPGFGWGEDNSAFLLLSRELQNFQYRETQDILAPVHARFPPGFPLMLAVVGTMVGDRIDPLFAFVALCSAASVLLLFDTVRRVLGEELAVLSAALYAINPSALGDAATLMSEAPFKLLLLLALWGASREQEGTRFAVIAGGATILAALTRTAGVVFIPALGAYWLWKRRYTWVLGLALAAVPVAAWLAFSFNAPDASDRRLYVADLRGRHDTVSDAIATRFANFRPRIEAYLSRHIPWTLSVPTIRGTPIDNIIWVAGFLVFGTVGMVAFLRNWLPAALFLASYVVLLAVWEFIFDRLLHPIVPLIFATLLAGVSAVSGRVVPRARRWAVLAVATLLAIGAIRRDVPHLKTRLACDRTVPADSPACWPLPERELLTLANWVRDSTPDDALFFVPKERAFFVHTGRKTINQDRGLREDTTTIGGYLRLRGVSYTVLTPVGLRVRAHASRLIGACREFDLVKQISPRTMLLKVAPEASATDSTPTCAAVRQFNMANNPAP
jgi:hypothetical protein